jgi:anti-sigma-K factor RskA
LEPKDIISSGILDLYASGLATGEEVKQVEHYAAVYPEVAAELAQIEAGMELYARAHGRQPDPSVKEKIFSRIDSLEEVKTAIPVVDYPTDKSAKVVSILHHWKFATAASVALLLGSIALNMEMYNKNIGAVKTLEQTQQQLTGLQEVNKVMAKDMEVVQSRYSQPVALHGLEAAPDAAAKIFWMANTGEVYVDPSNLPAAPAGKQYQLWGIVDGKPVDGGMILTSKKGDKYRIQKMKTFGKAEAFAITLEDNGGNPTPKGPMYVMGKM